MPARMTIEPISIFVGEYLPMFGLSILIAAARDVMPQDSSAASAQIINN